MSDLYFIASSNRDALADGRAILTDAEARHVARVMRKKIGDELALFDGSGKEYRAKIVSISKDRVDLDVLETRVDDREPSLALTVVMALPKGERQKWAIEKLVELGVKRVVPLDAERADVKFDDSTRERLVRQTIEATKQCGRLALMTITPSIAPKELPAFVELLNAKIQTSPASLSREASALADRFVDVGLFDEFAPGDDVLKAVAHPISDGDFGQSSFSSLVKSRDYRPPRGATLLIGPVGGFTDAEVQGAIDGGWSPLDLGRQVYRVETAAIVASALFLHWE